MKSVFVALALCQIAAVVLAKGSKGKSDSGSSSGSHDMEFFKHMMHRHHDHMMANPPDTLPKCLDHIKEEMENKTALVEFMWETKWDCKKECLSDDMKKCMPSQELLDGLTKDWETMKADFKTVADAGKECLLGKVKSGECSNEPIKFGMCGKGIFMEMIDEKSMKCMGTCGFRAFIGMLKDEGMVDGKEIAELMTKIVEGGEKMQHKIKHVMHGIMHHAHEHGPHHGPMKCLEHFCSTQALHDCAESTGLKDAMVKKFQAMEAMEKKLEADAFPRACDCVKKAAGDNIKEQFIKDADCSALPNKEVCMQLWTKHMSHHGSHSHSESKEEDEVKASRKRREVVELWSNAHMDFDMGY